MVHEQHNFTDTVLLSLFSHYWAVVKTLDHEMNTFLKAVYRDVHVKHE